MGARRLNSITNYEMFLKLFKKTIMYPLVAVLLLIFLHYTNILSPVESIVIQGMKPITSTFYSWSGGIRGFFNASVNKEELKEKVEELRATVNELRAERHRLQAVEEENKKLRQYLDFAEDKKLDQVLADVISTTLNLESGENKKSVLINKGADDGIRAGLVVVNSEGVVAGKISEAQKNTSKVELLTNEECRLAVAIQGEDKVMGVSEGQMGLTISMKFIPQTENIQVDDMVVTSGLEKDIPAGLVVGRITEVDNQSNKVWQSVNIEPLVDLNELAIVAIVKKTE